jgi:hypothetical protein
MKFLKKFWSSHGFPFLLPHIPPPSWSIALQIRSNQFNHRVSIDFHNMDIILHVGMQGIHNLTIVNTIETSWLCWHEPCTPWRNSFQNIFQLVEIQLVKIHQKGYLFERKKEWHAPLDGHEGGKIPWSGLKVNVDLLNYFFHEIFLLNFASIPFFPLAIILNMGLFFKSKFLVL